MVVLLDSGVFPPRPQVGLGNLLNRHRPTRFQSPPGRLMLVRNGTEYWLLVVMRRLVANVDSCVVSGSPNWIVPAAATPKPTPIRGLEVMNGATAVCLVWAACASAEVCHHPVARPSHAGKSSSGVYRSLARPGLPSNAGRAPAFPAPPARAPPATSGA